jgi:hypothetical protein
MNNPYLPIFFFILLWIIGTYLFSFIDGWRKLAIYYRYQGQSIGEKYHFQSGKIKWAAFGSCLTVGANQEGLYIAIAFLFRAGHPPLFIPWREIKIQRKVSFGFSMLEFKFDRIDSIPLLITQQLEDFLTNVARRRLPFEDSEQIVNTSNKSKWLPRLNLIMGIVGLIVGLVTIIALIFAP